MEAVKDRVVDMKAEVGVDVVELAELFAAFLARVWLFPGVYTRMPRQVVGLSKALTAFLTFSSFSPVCLLSCVFKLPTVTNLLPHH